MTGISPLSTIAIASSTVTPVPSSCDVRCVFWPLLSFAFGFAGVVATAASVAAVSGPSVSVTTLVSVPVSASTVLVSSTFLTVGVAAASPPVVTGVTGAAWGCTLATAWSANVCVCMGVACAASSAALLAAAFFKSASPSMRPARVPRAPVAVPITPPTPAPKTAPRPTARLNAAWSKPFCSPMSCL